MNKRGFFYSVSVLLCLFLVLAYFASTTQVMNAQESAHMFRAKAVVLDRFIRDFERYYVPRYFETAAGPAIINLTKEKGIFTIANIENLMQTGSVPGVTINTLLTTDELYDQSISTLSFAFVNDDFNYEIIDVQQDNRNLIITFAYDFRFETDDTTWEKNNGQYVLTVPIDGMYHPSYPANSYIESSWATVSGTCYANIIITDATAGCSEDFTPPTII
ncbi:MAG TPA: hypothetical protein VK158_01245 [Acidobacteriota bacterium]|nr:hypothetical protein [Acidobacteriota bacterium]